MTLLDISGIVEGFARFLILASIVIGVILIVWGAVMYITAGDDIARMHAAKTRIISGILGVFIILAVGLTIATLASLVIG